MTEKTEQSMPTKTDAEIYAEFECYGTLFTKADKTCMVDCFVRDRCIMLLGGKKVPALNQEAGRALTPDEIGEALGTDGESVAVCIAAAKGTPISKLLPIIGQPAPAAPPPAPTPTIAPPAAQGEAMAKTATKKAPPKKAAPVKAAPAAPVKAAPPATMTAKEKALVKKAQDAAKAAEKKKAADEKKAAAKAKVDAKVDAKKAATAQKKADAKAKAAEKKAATAQKKADAKKAAVNAAIAASTTLKMPAKKTAAKPTKGTVIEGASRYQRERARSPAVNALKVGQKIAREWDGKVHEVTVAADHYMLHGKQYPTLYAATTAIVGAEEYPKQKGDNGKRESGTRTMSNWSAPRFWRLAAQ